MRLLSVSLPSARLRFELAGHYYRYVPPGADSDAHTLETPVTRSSLYKFSVSRERETAHHRLDVLESGKTLNHIANLFSLITPAR